MKYIVGASIGGLFGLSMPLMINVDEIEDDNDSRIEESQPPEDESTALPESRLTLPDDYCSYISYESDDLKEQAKECLKRSIIALPSI
jgi:hypothetical protein